MINSIVHSTDPTVIIILFILTAVVITFFISCYSIVNNLSMVTGTLRMQKKIMEEQTALIKKQNEILKDQKADIGLIKSLTAEIRSSVE